MTSVSKKRKVKGTLLNRGALKEKKTKCRGAQIYNSSLRKELKKIEESSLNNNGV